MERHDSVEQLMQAFAERTGLAGSGAPQRYLWTDAFAVCNFLELYRMRGNPEFLDLARRLTTQVHDVLGAYAENDARSGWLGGMADRQHRATPTRAGLRIGKRLPERSPSEAFDESREWDRDGQYFHYLSRWMHTLERMAEATGESCYHRWAVDLAIAAFEGFVHQSPGPDGQRMYWKMSVDLDRPLVPSMGHHDPLDGWVVAIMLAQSPHAGPEARERLEPLVSAYREMFSMRELATGASLGIGGLLTDAWQLFRIPPGSLMSPGEQIAALIDAAAAGLEHVARRCELQAPPSRRLAFRELGLCIGLHAVERLGGALDDENETRVAPGALSKAVDRVQPLLRLSRTIEKLWLRPENRKLSVWTAHQDINDVMLAASLAPNGYLGDIPPGKPATEDST